MITDMQSTHVCPLVTGISNHVVGSSEVLGGVLCLLIFMYWFYYYYLLLFICFSVLLVLLVCIYR